MMQLAQHVQLVVNHLLVSLDVLFQDNLDGDFSLSRVGFSDNTISASTQGLAESVFGPASLCQHGLMFGGSRWKTDFFS